jgi:iron(II)-dependent oxidoreductase
MLLAFLIGWTATACESCISPAPIPFNSLTKVPGGWFLMGENNNRPSNNPQHQVYLDGYMIQIKEVSHQEFLEYINATGNLKEYWDMSTLKAEPDLPMTNTKWEDADAYCRWLGMRLPTEAEWEKAARGVDGREYPWGDHWKSNLSNYQGSSNGRLVVVNSYPGGQSPYGLLNMSGNAAEWVADYYDRDYYKYSPSNNPAGPARILDHVIRGGSYEDPPEWSTTYFRNSSHSALPNPRVGFRCAKSMLP